MITIPPAGTSLIPNPFKKHYLTINSTYTCNRAI
jgi:hypothetical protein